jgi:hypothetical protein
MKKENLKTFSSALEKLLCVMLPHELKIFIAKKFTTKSLKMRNFAATERMKAITRKEKETFQKELF